MPRGEVCFGGGSCARRGTVVRETRDKQDEMQLKSDSDKKKQPLPAIADKSDPFVSMF